MRTLAKPLSVLALLLGSVMGVQAQDIVYTVNETITGPLDGQAGNPTQTDSVVGSITTDGTIGALHSGNLVSWNLDLIDVTNPTNSIDLTQANSLISVDYGSVLNASATGLFFNFSGSGAFGFQADNPGQYSGYHYWCLDANWGGCLIGNSIAPGDVYAGVAGNDLVVAGIGVEGQLGNSPLDQTVSGGVPEVSTWVMMLIGFGGLGFAACRRTRPREARVSAIA